MVLKRSAPARRWACAAVSRGSTATGAAAGWRERNVEVRSSTTAASTSTRTSSAAPMVFFMVREGGATAPVRQEAPSDHSTVTLSGDDLRLRLRRRSVFPNGPHRVREGDLLDRRVSRRRAARGLRPSEPRARRATVGFRAPGTAMRHHAPPRGPLRKPRSPGGGAADHAPGTRGWRGATRTGGHAPAAVPPHRLGCPGACGDGAARRAARDTAIPVPGDPHPRPRHRPRGAVRGRARLAVFGRPVSGPQAPLPPRRRGRVRDDGFVATGPGARAAGAVLPAPGAGGAGHGTAARQARLPGRAGRADPRAARPRVERRRDRACPAWERSVVAAVDGRGLLQTKLRTGVPANA